MKLVCLAFLVAVHATAPQDGNTLAPQDREMSRMQSQGLKQDHTHFAASDQVAKDQQQEVKAPAVQPEHDDKKEQQQQQTDPNMARLLASQPAPPPATLSTAGKCYLALATLFFAVNAIIYVSGELKKNKIELPQSVIGDIIFNEERLNNSKSALIFIPVLAVLMLFIMFRARLQNVDGTGLVHPGIQNCMVLATMGIYMQALDIMDIRITSDALGNLSEKIGMLFVYLGYGGVVYGLFTVKDPDKPVSVAAQCILALCTLTFVLQILVKYLQYKSVIESMVPAVPSLPIKTGAPAGAPAASSFDVPPVPGADLVKGMFDETKLSAAITTCEMVPLVAMVYMFLHLNTVLTLGEDARPPDYARQAMYAGAAGIYLQTAACIILRDINEMAGTAARSIGLFITYAGFIVTLVYAISITPGEMANVGVLGMLYMVSAVLVFKAVQVGIEESAGRKEIPEDKAEKLAKVKEIMVLAADVLQYATILGILMIYIHFRAKIILFLPGLPDWVTFMELCAMISLFLQVSFVLLSSFLGDDTSVTVALKVLAMAGLYVGFGGIVAAAFLLERPSI